MQPFRIEVPEAVLADLRDRLARTRWPAAVAGQWVEHDRGGHFAALEVPDLFAADLRTFLTTR